MDHWRKLQKLLTPAVFLKWSGPLSKGVLKLSACCIAIGWFAGLFLAPADYQQGNVFRLIYIHVPAAILSLVGFIGIAISSGLFWIWHLKICHDAARAMASVGWVMTSLAIGTGALWGKPTWGCYWASDARLLAELILWFLYLAYWGFDRLLGRHPQKMHLLSILGLLGGLNVPIVHYSVRWWNTLHQGSTVSFQLNNPNMAFEMWWPLALSIVGFLLLFKGLVLGRVRLELLRRREDTTHHGL